MPRVAAPSAPPDALGLVGELQEGGVVAVEGTGPGSGAIAASLIADVTLGRLAAALDDGGLCPPDLASAGVDLTRLLIVAVQTPLEIARATDIVLRAGAFAMVVLPRATLSSVAWRRIALLARRTRTLVLAPSIGAPAITEIATLRLAYGVERVQWLAEDGLWNRLLGYDLVVHAVSRGAARKACTHLHVRARETPLLAQATVVADARPMHPTRIAAAR